MKKALQTILSLGIFYLVWKLFTSPFPDMSAVSKWSGSPVVFWVLWGIEAVFMLWWLLDEMRLTYLSVNPSVYLGWLWLAVALGLYVLNVRTIALVLVGIAAIPLGIMGLFLAVIFLVSIFSGPIRWN